MPAFESRLCHWLAGWPCAVDLTLPEPQLTLSVKRGGHGLPAHRTPAKRSLRVPTVALSVKRSAQSCRPILGKSLAGSQRWGRVPEISGCHWGHAFSKSLDAPTPSMRNNEFKTFVACQMSPDDAGVGLKGEPRPRPQIHIFSAPRDVARSRTLENSTGQVKVAYGARVTPLP